MRRNRVFPLATDTLCGSLTKIAPRHFHRIKITRHNAFSTRQPKIFPFDIPKNVAWELFGFGTGSKKFSRHNEKNLVPFL